MKGRASALRANSCFSQSVTSVGGGGGGGERGKWENPGGGLKRDLPLPGIEGKSWVFPAVGPSLHRQHPAVLSPFDPRRCDAQSFNQSGGATNCSALRFQARLREYDALGHLCLAGRADG